MVLDINPYPSCDMSKQGNNRNLKTLQKKYMEFQDTLYRNKHPSIPTLENSIQGFVRQLFTEKEIKE